MDEEIHDSKKTFDLAHRNILDTATGRTSGRVAKIAHANKLTDA